MNSIASFAPWVGSACCCLAFFVLLIVIAAFIFRSKKPTPEQIEGLPAAPGSGVQTRASLTMLEYEPTQRTPRPAPIPSRTQDTPTLRSIPAIARPPAPVNRAQAAESLSPTVKAQPDPVRPPPVPEDDEGDGAMTSVMDRGRQPDLPPPPPPPPGTITASPSAPPLVRARMVEPNPTVGDAGVPPPLPRSEK